MKKVIGQTVRDLKREVNKKVLKVPGIEQKVLDATSNEAWGPHGSLLADIAQASRNYYEYQMIMAVIWKRISDTRKNWRHVYKALTVLEYLVAHGSERVIDEIKERAHQISTLSDFYYIDSSGRDQGSNVRKKSQSLIVLVNDKERIAEVRQKAAANRNKFRSNSGGGMYRPSSYSGSGTYGDKYDDDRYRSREEDRRGYGSGRERDWGYKDDDQYGRDGDRYGRDYEESSSRDGYRDGENRGRNQSVGDYRYGSRNRISDRDPEHSYDDDGHRSSRGSSTKAEDLSLEGRLGRKLSEQNTSAPPSYEEVVSQSPLHNERGGEISAASAPKGSSPVSDNPHQTYAPTGSSLFSDNPTETTAADKTAASGSHVAEASEFDPRGPVSAAPASANNVEMDLFGSVSDSFSPNVLALAPSESEKTASRGNANPDSKVSFTSPQSASNDFNPLFEDPFGDSPFKAIPSTETTPSQPQTHQSLESSQSSGPYEGTISNFEFGDSFSFVPYSTSGAGYTQPLSSNSAFVPQELSTPSQETDILADILPPAPLPGITSQQNFTAPPDAQSSSEQTASQSLFVQTGQLAQPPFSVPASQHAQQPFPAHADQHAHSGGHMYSGFHSQSMFPQFQSGHMAPTGQMSQRANYFTQHGGSQSPTDQAQASHFNNSGNFIAQPRAAKQNEPSKDKFETKSTVWADTLSRGLVNLNISGSKINPLADIGIDFDAINRKEKRMEKPSMTPVTSTITMGKAMGSGSGMGRAGAGALRPPSNPMMGVGMGMGGYGGMSVPMGMGMGQGVQMQPPTGLPPIRGNYNTMMGPGGYPQHPYGGAGYQ